MSSRRSSWWLLGAAVSATIAVAASGAQAGGGILDTTFGHGGKVLTDVGAGGGDGSPEVFARLPLHDDRGRSAGWVVLRAATQDELDAQSTTGPQVAIDVTPRRPFERYDIRAGTCTRFERTRPRHYYQGALTWFDWAYLQPRRWVLEIFRRWGDLVPQACAAHPGAVSLDRGRPAYIQNDRKPRPGRNTIVTDLVSAAGEVVGTARLTRRPIGFQVDVKEREFSGDATLEDPPPHIRPGTCERISPGRDILLPLLDDDDTDAVWAYGSARIGVSWQSIVQTPHVIEVQSYYTGNGVHSCGELSTA